MPNAAVVAAALTDHSTRYRTLTIDGVDVAIKPTGAQGQRYGVPIDSIRIVEAGPGGVSSMTFEIEDPNNEISIRRGSIVQLYHAALDYPEFLGFAIRRTVKPLTLGRRIAVRASGVEVLLDWAKVAQTTFSWGVPNTLNATTAIQSLAAACVTGTTLPLRAFASLGATSTQAGPIQGLTLGSVGPTFPAAPGSLTIRAGTTLREAIRQVMSIADGHPSWWWCATVDFTLGLRVWLQLADQTYQLAGPGVGDWSILDVQDTGTGRATTALEDVLDGDAPSDVYVQGTGVAALVSDASGDNVETAYINEPGVTDTQTAQLFGQNYLRQFTDLSGGPLRRGSFVLENVPDATLEGVHPGIPIDIKDDEIGIAISPLLGQIEKRLYATTQDVTITYGGLPPSFATLTRRVTRATPN